MKLVTFTHDSRTRIGALLDENTILDFSKAVSSLPQDMVSFLEGGAATMEKAQKAVAAASSDAKLALDSVRLEAPILNPQKILCIGLNYADHAAESGLPLPQYPVLFTKYNNTIIAHGDNIILPNVSKEVDYEAELGFVIGKRAKGVSAADAMEYIAGYTIINDVSARDYQMRTSQWTIGKTFDTFAPMGPALVTADEISDPENLRISLRIGDEVLQDSSTKQLIFGIAALVESLSETMTLEPGDIVSTGTPPGVGFARKPPIFLKAGDVVHVEVEGLGTLTNPVVAEA